MENCIVIGAGTYGQVYAEYLKATYNVLGFIDDDINLSGKQINGFPVLGNFDYLLSGTDIAVNIFVPIGNNATRISLLKQLIKKGFKTPNFIHADAHIHDSVKLGTAVYILPGSYIMPLTEIGDFVLISMGVNIAHHVRIDTGCFFSQGSNIGASVHFEERVFCGIGCTVMTGVKTIGANATIGAAAVIIRDVSPNAVVVGNPGKVIKYK